MKTQYTKGPWVINGGGSPAGGKFLLIQSVRGDVICDVRHLPPPNHMEMDGNANLIAAAPDLLEACIDAYAHLKGKILLSPLQELTLRKLTAAIVKAEGRKI